jgi:REP-associated tyrosine transposase
MPRQARIDAPGALHHIICRGIERRPIFKDDEDHNDFVRRLAILLPQTSTRCYAWALIPNHFHLLLKTGEVPIAILMRRLLTGYAISFNRRYRRHGHLFQNRYKSILCQEETYLLELIRYIHLNPLRARRVTSLEELVTYPWCGHGGLLGQREVQWQATSEILAHFGKRLSSARRHYQDFVADGVGQGKRPELTGGGLIRSSGGWKQLQEQAGADLRRKSDERILGDGDFVEATLAEAEEVLERQARYRQQGITFDTLVERLSTHFDLDAEELLSAGKQPLRVRARSLLCYWAVRQLGMTTTAVAGKVGMTQPAVSRAVERGRKLSKELGIDLSGRIL